MYLEKLYMAPTEDTLENKRKQSILDQGEHTI